MKIVRISLAALAALLWLVAGPAWAHKSSDSYLQVTMAASGMKARWDIALRDLDVAIDLDSDADGRLTWGEVRTAWPRIEAYVLPRLQIEGCTLTPTGRALERRNDGAYAVIFLASPCVSATDPRIAYTLFRDVDPTHRGVAKIERAGQPVRLAVLDPTQAVNLAAAAAASGPVGAVATTPGAATAAAVAPSRLQFLAEGARHILTGYDHVLFLLCLMLPAVMRRTPSGWQPVERLSQAILPIIGIVSAFTVAHSITLALAALKIVSLSSAFIEPAIAVTIALAAVDNIWPIFPVRRVVVTFFFGLIHGFGFASVLAELNLPTADFAWALLQFNLGIEFGQLLIVIAATSVLFALRDWPRYRPLVLRGGSMVAMVIACAWFIERTANVSILPF